MRLRLFLVLFLVAGLCGCASSDERNTGSSAQKSVPSEKNITAEYDGLNEKNAFYYGDDKALVNFIQNGTGVVFFGNPGKQNSQKYIVYLNDVLEENSLQAAVFDIRDIQKNQNILKKTNDLLNKQSGGKLTFEKEKGPLVVFLNNGRVIAWNDETAEDEDVRSYWTDGKVSDLKTRLEKAAVEIRKAQEDSTNKGCEKACTFGGD